MKKILFETIGNILMMSLFSGATIEIFSKNAEYSVNGQLFSPGKVSIAFLIYLILFGLSKWIFSKKIKIIHQKMASLVLLMKGSEAIRILLQSFLTKQSLQA
ncbi:hypothetical protein LZ578_02590 [Jeotgalibaca sp. MA1X17-3]|uniref:hypothetical protein n=1 Tax=Jeotgalibaca sp. MA1X17-3 TaxID=2908211 RepID=UPI001F44283A|nr:hypothetical protein [Jeotgalibaca sp. MA1X17-3]UJF16047.1 hypothetical protein LZ578_02590 [Jeotgalibaca sp. MA1X17-3]